MEKEKSQGRGFIKKVLTHCARIFNNHDSLRPGPEGTSSFRLVPFIRFIPPLLNFSRVLLQVTAPPQIQSSQQV